MLLASNMSGLGIVFVAFPLLFIANIAAVIAAFLLNARWALSPLPLIIGILAITMIGLKLFGGLSLLIFPGAGAILICIASLILQRVGWI